MDLVRRNLLPSYKSPGVDFPPGQQVLMSRLTRSTVSKVTDRNEAPVVQSIQNVSHQVISLIW